MKKTPIKKRRTKPRRRVNACKPYLEWLPQQPCVLTGKRTGEYATSDLWGDLRVGKVAIDPAHVRTRRNNGDLWNAVSLAHHLHEDQHQHGIHTWCAKHGITLDDLKALAVKQTEQFLDLYPEYRPTTESL